MRSAAARRRAWATSPAIAPRGSAREAYRRKWDKWNADHKGDPPTRDLGNETLAEVLRGNILVHNHCYRADEMAQMIDIAQRIRLQDPRRSITASRRTRSPTCSRRKESAASLWADWGSFKMEALDGVRGNIALVDHAGAQSRSCTRTIHRARSGLNQEAAKAMAAGNGSRAFPSPKTRRSSG